MSSAALWAALLANLFTSLVLFLKKSQATFIIKTILVDRVGYYWLPPVRASSHLVHPLKLRSCLPQTFKTTSSRLHNILKMSYVLEWMFSDKK
jgi:hypothetical protein